MKKQAMSVDIFGSTLTITFSNGHDLAIDVTTLTPEIQRMAMLHGIKQKLVDAAAIARNTETGRSADVQDKFDAVQEVYIRLTRANNPTWNKERAAAGLPANTNKLLIRALMRMTGRDKAYVDDFLSSKTKEQREALKTNPRVLAIIAELQAAAPKSGVDTDGLLEELGADVESSDEPDEEIAVEPLVITPQLAMPQHTPKKRTRKVEVAA